MKHSGLTRGNRYSRRLVSLLLNLLACAAFPIVVNSAHAGSVDEDFETGNLSRFPWQTGGDTAWQVSSDANVTPLGTYSARSGTIADNQMSELKVELPVQAGVVSFSLKTSVELQGDYLKFLIDGVEQAVWTGDTNWTQSGSFSVPAGVHTFSWIYAKDATDCGVTTDRVWIDDIDFPSVSSFLPDLMIRGSGESAYLGQDVNSGDGANQTKASWISSGETASYVLRLRNKGIVADTFKVTAPPAGTGWKIRYFDAAAASGGAEVTSQVVGPGWVTVSVASGGFTEFRAEVSTLAAPTEGMVSDCPVTARSNGSTAFADVVKATTHFTFASADENFESGGFNLWPWKMGGDQGWQITTAENVTAGGTYSARSGSILIGQTSELSTTLGVTAGVLSYACKVSSSPGYGRLEFCIDGVLKDTWSGEIDWTRSAEYSVATGVHTFLWKYIKDSATVGGQDAAWLDNIDLPPRSPYFPDALLRTKNDTSFVGDGVFNLNGTNQSRTQWVSPSSKAIYVVRVQNEGLSTDSISINSVGSSVGWTVRLFDAATGGNEITSQTFGAGWPTPQLAPGGTLDLRLEITPDNSVPLTSGLDVGVVATSVGDRTWRDVVKATTVVGVPPADEDFETGDLAKWPWQSTGWSNSSADNITAEGTFSASVQPAQGETNELKLTLILNAGNLKFYYRTSGQNGSDQLKLTIDGTQVGQWSGTANWTPSQDFAIAAGSHTFSWSFTRNSTTPSAGAWLDNIDFPPVAVNQGDALIKRCSDSASSFQQDGVYQDIPSGAQVVQQVAGSSVTACYQVKIENDGSTNQSFAVRTSESNGSGWGIVYMIGAIDLTGLVRSATGYVTASLAPGASEVITVSVTPDNSVPPSSTQSTTVQVYLPGGDTQVRDSVKAITTTPPTVQFSSASQISASESGILTVSIDLSAPTIEEVVVPFSISGTATDSIDYTMIPVGSVTIPPGQTSASLLINIVDDLLDEPDESIIVTLGDPVHATKGATTIHTATITDDDAPPGLSISDVSVTEGNSGTTGAVFVVSLSAASGKTITVDYSTANGSAQAGSDYVALTGSLTFAPGDISKSVTVTVNGDTLREPDEDFSVNLSNQTNAWLLDAAGKCTLINDDATPTMTVGNASVTEGNSGLQNLVFQLALSSPSAETITAGYTTANGTASATDDYVATSGTVTFNPMDTSRSVTVSVRGDTLYEPDETLLLNLSNPVNVALNNTQAVGSILNDDPKPDQPDLLIRKGTEPDSSFAIDNVYQTTPSGDQIETQIVPAKTKTTYAVRVQNNGGSTRTFLLKAAESSGVGWTVVYKSGGTVITSAIKGTGTTTSSLAPGAAAVITVEMTPGGTVAENASKSATIRAYLGGSDTTTIKDAVQAVTVKKTIKQPDGLIRRLDETDASYAEDNIYQTTPAGNQIETQTVTRGTKAVCLVKVQNDGNVSQSFTVKAAETTATGWTVAYKVGTTTVTSSIKSLGYTTPVLSPGSSVIITVEMTPGSGVAIGGIKSSTIRTMVGSSVLDAVQATTIVGTVASLSASVTSTQSQDKARIVWQDEPPEGMAAGMNYAVSWQVIGGWQVTHTYVVMSNSPVPSRNPAAMTEALAGEPGLFRSWIPAPSSEGLYYQVIAVVDGKLVTSEVLYRATVRTRSQSGG